MSCLTSIHVLIFATHLHPGDISAPSRSLELHLNSIHVQSQTHPDLKMCVSPISRPCLICIQVSRFLHQLLQCTFSPPSRSENANQLNSGPYQTHSGIRMCASPPSMSCLTSFQVPKFLSHLHPCTGSFPSRSKDSYLTFIHVQFHFRLGNYIGISHPSMSRLAYNQDWVLCLAFIQVTFNWLVGHENSISTPF